MSGRWSTIERPHPRVVHAALLIALPMLAACVLLLRSGIETRGQRLEDIERAMAERA